ncbi:hypothetical protein LPB41_20425 [Thalassospira sp. MA62]|nr:hypothetical protein [Thalassospira sp. MA62]
MTQSADLLQTIQTTLTALEPVLKDIQARPDYAKDEKLLADAASLATFRQSLLNYKAQSAPTKGQTAALKDDATKINNPLLVGLFNNNVALSQMGQLNTSRTIPPSQAQANNVNIGKLQDALQVLIAQTNAALEGGTAPSIAARIVSLAVPEAERTASGLLYQTYNSSLLLSIRAVTEPDTPDAWQQISWTGGQPDPSGIANWRTVPLNAITPVGHPQIITASVNGASQSVKIAVVPDLLRFDVTGAMADGGDSWSLQSDTQTQVIVRAVTEPATPEAYKWLKWTGGTVDPKNPDDRRLVTAQQVAASGTQLPVEVNVNVQ